MVGVVGHGAPGEVHRVQGDDGRLQQARAWVDLLDGRQDGHDGHDHAQDHVEADEELVQTAVTLYEHCSWIYIICKCLYYVIFFKEPV